MAVALLTHVGMIWYSITWSQIDLKTLLKASLFFYVLLGQRLLVACSKWLVIGWESASDQTMNTHRKRRMTFAVVLTSSWWACSRRPSSKGGLSQRHWILIGYQHLSDWILLGTSWNSLEQLCITVQLWPKAGNGWHRIHKFSRPLIRSDPDLPSVHIVSEYTE